MEIQLKDGFEKSGQAKTILKLRNKSDNENKISELLNLFYSKSKESNIYSYYEFEGDFLNSEKGIFSYIVEDIFTNKQDIILKTKEFVPMLKDVLLSINN